MRTGHLFAGAGGGLLADRILGHTPVFAVEWDKYACEVLRQRSAEGWYPGLHVHEGDISLWNPSEYAGRVDSLHAGFPCTDISLAGNGEGIEGAQSGLWSEVVRVADVLRPRELFLENSPAIVNRGLDRVLSDLAALGYDAKWLCLSADRVGAPHERDRWWCLANARGGRCDTSEEGEIQHHGSPENAHAESQRLPRIRIGSGVKEKYTRPSCPNWWAVEPDLGRMVYGVANRAHRIRALGNGQVPLQAALAYQLLKLALDQK